MTNSACLTLLISQYRINELISIKPLFIAFNLTEFDSRNSARMTHDANNTITGLISLPQRAAKKKKKKRVTPKMDISRCEDMKTLTRDE